MILWFGLGFASGVIAMFGLALCMCAGQADRRRSRLPRNPMADHPRCDDRIDSWKGP